MAALNYKSLKPAEKDALEGYRRFREAIVAAMQASFPDPKGVPIDSVLAALAHETAELIKAVPPDRRDLCENYVIECLRDAIRKGGH
jgi:hypothetical protein